MFAKNNCAHAHEARQSAMMEASRRTLSQLPLTPYWQGSTSLRGEEGSMGSRSLIRTIGNKQK